MISSESFADRVLRFVAAVVIIESLLVFLFIALVHPDFNYLTENAEGIIVGGSVSIITLIVNSLFQGEATRAASRASAQATQAGINAALTTPGAPPSEPAVVPTVVPTEDPAKPDIFMCPVDGLTFTTQADLDTHLTEVHPPEAPKG